MSMHPRQNPAVLACAFWLATQVAAAPADPAQPQRVIPPDTTALPKDTAAPAGPDYAAYLDRDSSRSDTLVLAAPITAGPQAAKVGFSGFFETRLHGNRYLDHAPWMAPDAAGSRLGGRLGLRIAASANAHMAARAAVTFADDFSGRYLNGRASKSPRRVVIPGVGEGPDTAFADGLPYPGGRGPEGSAAGLFEDLLAEVELKSRLADAVLKAGTTLWAQGSPLTLWNRDGRVKRAWHYETFESELSSAQYYESKAYSRGADLGRHAWPKRALAGLALETTRMPRGLALQATVAEASALLPTEPGGYGGAQVDGEPGLLEAGGPGSRGRLWQSRLSRRTPDGRHVLGLNALAAFLPEDLIRQQDVSAGPANGFVHQFKGGRTPFHVNPRVISLDLSGDLGDMGPALAYHGEAALSLDDTVQYRAAPGPDSLRVRTYAARHLRGPPSPAAWLKLAGSGSLPFETDLLFASPRFHSPYAMTGQGRSEYGPEVAGIDLGAGVRRYHGNLAGLAVKLSPILSGGFLVVTLSQHMQVAPGPDILRFEHTLNGRELWEATASATRTRPARPLDQGQVAGTPRYDARLGRTVASPLPLHGEARPGGLRGGDREIHEEFAAYGSKAAADSGSPPESRKHASTLALDWGWRIDPWLGLWRPLLINVQAEAASLGTDLAALGRPAKALLWSGKLLVEPAFSLTSDFHLLAQAGIETWRSDFAWRNALANQAVPGQFNNRTYYEPLSALSPASQNAVAQVDAVKAPIRYRQVAWGLGCDWDFTPRAGLHLRVKQASHRDAEMPQNDWSGWFLFAGLKLWI